MSFFHKDRIPPHLLEFFCAAEIGAEKTPDEFVAELVAVFREVRRVLKDDGVLWVNIGDSYANDGKWGGSSGGKHVAGLHGASGIGRGKTHTGCKPKDLIGIPWMLAFALRADGWYLRGDNVWGKPNGMPESVQGSHFSRHRVTISDYERLSGLPYTDERAGEDWAGGMPALSEIEIPRSKAPLSAKPKGDGDNSSARGSGGCQGEEATRLGIGGSKGPSGKISKNGESKGRSANEGQNIQRNRERETQICGASFGHKRPSAPDNTEAKSQRYLCQNGEDGSQEAARLCETQGCDCCRTALHSGDVAGNRSAAQEPLPLLQEEAGFDDRSCDPGQQGRLAHPVEHRSSMSDLQLTKGQQDGSDLLVGCPGCNKCSKHHGYLFHLSAGRPTRSHEYVFLLTKSARYYYDHEAVRSAPKASTQTQIAKPYTGQSTKGYEGSGVQNASDIKRRITDKQRGHSRRHDGFNDRWDAMEKSEQMAEGGNLRSVWWISPAQFREGHFAVMPDLLAEICILAGSKSGDTILDPFGGAGTTGLVADRIGRNAIMIELNPEFATMARNRIEGDNPLFAEVS